MATIVEILKQANPRAPLCRELGISPQYANDITKGKAIGGTLTLAELSAKLGLSDEEIGATVREMYRKVFAAEARRSRRKCVNDAVAELSQNTAA